MPGKTYSCSACHAGQSTRMTRPMPVLVEEDDKGWSNVVVDPSVGQAI